MSFLNFLSKIFSAIFIVTLLGCVSVNVGGAKVVRSNEIRFSEPTKPFREVKTSEQDKAWRNEKNGNTISFLSECNDPAEPSLEQIVDGITSDVDEAKKIERDQIEFNSRPAIHSMIDGKVDGISTRFELVVFKKDNCIFVLTYAAVSSDFASNQKDFNMFAKRFQVP